MAKEAKARWPAGSGGGRVLVLDNDETTGSYQLGSLLFSMYTQLCGTPPSVHYFVENYLKKGGARPGSAELLQRAYAMLQNGSIDEIIIFTAASNHTGWVDFLKAALEEYAGIPPESISRIISAEHCTARDPSTGRSYKDLRLVHPDTSKVLIIDDKPDYVRNGTVVAVSEYNQHVPIDHLVAVMPCSPAKQAYAKEALQRDQALFRPSEVDFSNDRELFRAIDTMETFFGGNYKVQGKEQGGNIAAEDTTAAVTAAAAAAATTTAVL